MAGKKIGELTPLGRNLISTDELELSLTGSAGSRKITGQEILNSMGITIGTTAITSGTVGRVLFEGTGNVVSESANLFWDNTNGRLGIGTSTPTVALDIVGVGKFSSNLNVGSTTFTSTATPNFISLGATYGDGTNFGTKIKLLDSGATQWGIGASSATGINYFGTNHHFYGTVSNESIKLFPSASNSSTATPSYLDLGSSFSSTAGANPKIRLFGTSYAIGMSAGAVEYFAPKHVFYTGNVLINTTTDAGYKLDVNGTARVQTSLDVNTGSGILANGANNPVVINSNYWSNGDGFVIASKNTSDSSPKLTLRANSAGSCSLQLYNNGNKSYIRQINTSGLGGQSVYLFQLDNRQAKLAVTADDSTTDASFFGKAIWDGGSAATFRASSATQTANIINVQNHDGTSTFLNVKPTGNVLINTTTDIASSKLTIESTTQGVLFPRMTTTQKNAIASPATGLMVYDTTLNLMALYNGTTWTTL